MFGELTTGGSIFMMARSLPRGGGVVNRSSGVESLLGWNGAVARP